MRGADLLVDSNLHVSAPPAARTTYPLTPLAGTAAEFSEDKTTTAEGIALMDEAGVDQAFRIGSRFHGFDNAYCADAAARYPDKFVDIANVDILTPEAAEHVRYWIGERGMHEIRFWGSGRGSAVWIDEPRLRSPWKVVQELGVPANAHTTYLDALTPTRRFLDRFGEIALTINRPGHVDPTGGPASPAARELLELAAYPKVFVNVPVDELPRRRHAGSAAVDFLHALSWNGSVDTGCFGRFYPSRRDRSFAESADILMDAVADLSLDDRRGLLGGSARSLYPALDTRPRCTPDEREK
jgi:hypothetical protein